VNFQTFLVQVDVNELQKVPERIANFLIVDSKHYHSLVGNSEKTEEKNKLDSEMIKFKTSKDFIGIYSKGDLKIYVKSYNYSKKFAEKKIMEFLKGV